MAVANGQIAARVLVNPWAEPFGLGRDLRHIVKSQSCHWSDVLVPCAHIKKALANRILKSVSKNALKAAEVKVTGLRPAVAGPAAILLNAGGDATLPEKEFKRQLLKLVDAIVERELAKEDGEYPIPPANGDRGIPISPEPRNGSSTPALPAPPP